ncbi:hypothetical protein HHK36_014060 [Tetracentron sinense]|uniref:Uncharacterized protein n=1 Tax=Tetracentron sinense TaxID=13715 RepID=A0A834Z5C5_TETSI|nr:hypothetical protein HHK36_014060 [Tetracentron sinense]
MSLPVLAGAAGALGATYITVDGGYYARPSGQTSFLGVSSKESSANKPSNVWRPPQTPELVNDEFGQRQNKPRRQAFFPALCNLQFLFWSTLGSNMSQDMLAIQQPPAHAAVNLRRVLQLDGWQFLFKLAVFLWLAGFFVKLVRNGRGLLQA